LALSFCDCCAASSLPRPRPCCRPRSAQIDFGQKLGIEQRAVEFALGVVDLETSAEASRLAGWPGISAAPSAAYQSRAHRQGLEAGGLQFRIEELHVELGVVDDQRRLADEIDERADLFGEQRMPLKESVVRPCTRVASCGTSRIGLR